MTDSCPLEVKSWDVLHEVFDRCFWVSRENMFEEMKASGSSVRDSVK